MKFKILSLLFVFFPLSGWALEYDVVVVGGGLSGLVATQSLMYDKRVLLVEESDRLGGRIDTQIWDGNNIENGAEFINSTDLRIMALVKKFGLKLVPLNRSRQGTVFIMGGAIYSYKELEARFFLENRESIRRLTENKVPEGTSVQEVMDRFQFSEWGRELVKMVLFSELGKSLKRIDAKELMHYFSFDVENSQIHLSPYTDENYKLLGGTERLTRAIASSIPHQIIWKNTKLLKVVVGEGRFQLILKNGHRISRVTARDLVLAIPPDKLTDVDFSVEENTLSRVVKISNMTAARTSKMYLRFKNPIWRKYGFTGSGWSSKGFSFIHVSVNQPLQEPMLLIYSGLLSRYMEEKDYLDLVLRELESVFPGIEKEFIDYKLFEFETSYFGHQEIGLAHKSLIKEVRELPFYMVGDGMSIEHTGYMEGAIESAQRVANSIAGRWSQCRLGFD